MSAISPVQTYRWLITRELWEHRGRFIIAPLVLGGIILLGAIGAILKFGPMIVQSTDAPRFEAKFLQAMPNYLSASFAAPFLMVVAFVTCYYALDALYADRRDRSVLFWKSMPVSDLDTVLSKLAIAALVAPFIGLVIALITQLAVLLTITIGVAVHRGSVSTVLSVFSINDSVQFVVYTAIALSLWYAPVWAWCLLASSWARRAPFLWATIPIGALWLLEARVLGSNHVGHILQTRLFGLFPQAFSVSRLDRGDPVVAAFRGDDFMQIGNFFSSPDLWIGLLVAAALVAATVWVRRYREAN